MPSSIVDRTTYEFENPKGFESPDEVHSWEYGNYPKVVASVSVTSGARVDVYGDATRWSLTHISVSWMDDAQHTHWAWMPKDDVRQVTDSEWDIEEYSRCPENLRSIRWGNRLPGFLPS